MNLFRIDHLNLLAEGLPPLIRGRVIAVNLGMHSMDDGQMQGVDRSAGPCREGRRCRESQAPRPGRERPERAWSRMELGAG